MNVIPYGRAHRARRDRMAGWVLFALAVAVVSAGLLPALIPPSPSEITRTAGPRQVTYSTFLDVPLQAPAPAAAAPPAPAAPVLAELANLPAAPPLAAALKDAPGVAVTFFPAGKEDDPSAGDARSSRMLALHVPAGASPSPFLRGTPGGATPWVAVYDGAIALRLRDTFTFSAEGRGKLVVTVNDKLVLSAEGDDFAKRPAGQPVRLNKGKNKLRVRYEPPADGGAVGAGGDAAGGDAAGSGASFRLLWTAKGEHYPEPIPPTALSHDAGAEAVARGERLREGRLIFAEQRCAACHAAEGLTAKPIPVDPVQATRQAVSSPMPELATDAPDLTTAGARLNKDWMAVWVNDPKSVRADPHMPRVFTPTGGGSNAGGGTTGAIDLRAADVAAFLATLGPDAQRPKFEPTPEKVARGGQLFTHLNCNVCHEPPGGAAAGNAGPSTAAPGVGEAASGKAVDAANDEPAPSARVPLKYVKAKYQPHALVAFLLNPSEHYRWIRMPNFRFKPEEADAVAAFLLAESSGTLPANLPNGDPAKGRQLVESSGCLNCHAAGEAKSTLAAPKLAEIPKDNWSRGCMAPADVAGAGGKSADRGSADGTSAPAFHLSEKERTALLAFAATDRSSLLSDAPAEFAARQVRALNCVGCHARDGKESLLVTLYDAEHKALEQTYPAPPADHPGAFFAPDQRPPLMTWFGEKLRPRWTAAFVAGQVDDKPRPYLHARMPAFATRAGLLAAGMAAEHGVGPIDPPPEKPDPAQAVVGSKLSGKTPNESFSCTQCHAVAAMPPFAPFEAPAVNFALAAERLRKDYYHRWVHNPLKLDPNTKMPAFEREDGTTPVTAVYDGNARKQFEAIWQYLLAGREIKPPVE